MLVLAFMVVGTTILAARAKLESLRDRARADSLRDPLTGLANRRALASHFHQSTLARRQSDRLGWC